MSGPGQRLSMTAPVSENRWAPAATCGTAKRSISQPPPMRALAMKPVITEVAPSAMAVWPP